MAEDKGANTEQKSDAEDSKHPGGRGFGRNIERLLLELGNRRCLITSVPQTQNKESRILASSAWVNRHVFHASQLEAQVPGALPTAHELSEDGAEPERRRPGRPSSHL
jgi:hypothetical protein